MTCTFCDGPIAKNPCGATACVAAHRAHCVDCREAERIEAEAQWFLAHADLAGESLEQADIEAHRSVA